MSAWLSPRATAAQFGAGKNGAGGVDPGRLGGFHGNGAELMQTDLHFVGDVAQIAAAACCAAIVHLEVDDDAGFVHLDTLGVLTADVQHGAGTGEHHVGAETVAEDLGADMLLGKRQPHPAITGADHIGLFQFDVEDFL